MPKLEFPGNNDRQKNDLGLDLLLVLVDDVLAFEERRLVTLSKDILNGAAKRALRTIPGQRQQAQRL